MASVPDFELIVTQPDPAVQEAEYRRLLGYPRDHEPTGRALELARWVRDWYSEHGRPWIYGRTTRVELIEDKPCLGGKFFNSPRLCEQLAAVEAEAAVLIAASAGPQLEAHARELWKQSKPDEYFFLEMFGSAVVEHLVAQASGRICAWAEGERLAVLPHFSPGYSGWDVADQNKLWSLFHKGTMDVLPGPLEVLDSGMLRPKKSLLAVIGLTRHTEKARELAALVPCENCALPRCQYRRGPYRHAPPQVEDGGRLQSTACAVSSDTPAIDSPLTRNASYSVGAKALKKWSDERLKLNSNRDGEIEASFRYEGTTCTNLGRTLEFDYFIRLSPRAEGYRILEMRCEPAPGDTGHASMCEYLNNAAALMRDIASEKPLLGRPLNEVLTWSRAANPSGCYCDSERRMHKWGLVLEVLHYALAQRGQELPHGQTQTSLG